MPSIYNNPLPKDATSEESQAYWQGNTIGLQVSKQEVPPFLSAKTREIIDATLPKEGLAKPFDQMNPVEKNRERWKVIEGNLDAKIKKEQEAAKLVIPAPKDPLASIDKKTLSPAEVLYYDYKINGGDRDKTFKHLDKYSKELDPQAKKLVEDNPSEFGNKSFNELKPTQKNELRLAQLEQNFTKKVLADEVGETKKAAPGNRKKVKKAKGKSKRKPSTNASSTQRTSERTLEKPKSSFSLSGFFKWLWTSFTLWAFNEEFK